MTYREIFAKLSEADLDKEVTIFDVSDDEFYPVSTFERTEGDDVLDDNHPVICIKAPQEREA